MASTVARTGSLAQPSLRRRRGFSEGNGPVLMVLAIFLVVWELAGRTLGLLYLPPVSEILMAFGRLILDGTVPREILASLTAFAAGMAIAVIGGVLIGLLMGMSRIARWTLDVYVDGLMTAPVVAFVPLFILLFGLGFETRIATVVLFAIFPVILNTMAGIRGVDPNLLLMSKSLGYSSWQRFWTVQLPAAYPHIETGLRTSAARGVDGVITGEVLIASIGIGGLISRFGNGFSMPELYAVVIVIVLLVLLAGKSVDLFGLLVPRRRATGTGTIKRLRGSAATAR